MRPGRARSLKVVEATAVRADVRPAPRFAEKVRSAREGLVSTVADPGSRIAIILCLLTATTTCLALAGFAVHRGLGFLGLAVGLLITIFTLGGSADESPPPDGEGG